MWQATVLRPGGREEDRPRSITAATATSQLGGDAWLDLEFNDLSGLLPMGMGSRVSVAWEGPRGYLPEFEELPEFVVVGLGAGRGIDEGFVRLTRMDQEGGAWNDGGCEREEELKVFLWQRLEGWSVWEFLRGVGGDCLAETLDVRDGVPARLDAAYPQLCCVATSVGVPGGEALRRVTDALVGRRPMAGLFRTVADGKYRVAGVYADEASAGQRMKLGGASWSFARASDACSVGVRRMENAARVDAPEVYFAHVFSPDLRSLHEGASEEDEEEIGPCPLAPCTIAVDDQVWFARRITTRIELGPPTGAPRRRHGVGTKNVFRIVDLVSLQSAMARGRRPGTTTLLGMVSERPTHDTLVPLSPPDAASLESLNGSARALARWGNPLGDPIFACMAAPGFVRKTTGKAALYAPLEAGDLVLFDVTDTGTVVIRGALHRRMQEMENATITLSGERVDVNADVGMSGKRVVVRGEVEVFGSLNVQE